MKILHLIRLFIVRQFALNYLIKIFGIGPWRTGLRCTRIIFPLVAITGYFWVTSPDYPNPTALAIVLFILMCISLFIGFIYFRIWPVKWEELDDFQKYQYGYIKEEKLTPEQYIEWLRILDELILKYPDL